MTGFDQVLLPSTLCKQVRDEVQAQSHLKPRRETHGGMAHTTPSQTTSDGKKFKLLQKSNVGGPCWVSTCNRDLTGQSGSYSS